MKVKNKQTFIYGILAAHICVFLYLLVSASYQPPERLIEPEKYKKMLNIGETDAETTYVAPPIQMPELEKIHADYGKKDIFTSIMPTPSPEPTRTPRPTPTPSLERVMKNYEMNGVVGQTVFMVNKRTKEELMVKVGETIEEEDRSQKMKVQLLSVNPATFEAKFKYEDQEFDLKLQF